ncbi:MULTISPECIES: hypothetical protein [Spirulina sp. CCY15215]|uniref:hypothetical protein n=1 Tax=Spirulina sp. CCY15215 TaxID=2767591 RepID=UPI001951A535|nr:hypothetical protein [Spirulina major]
MQALKLEGAIDESGHLIVSEPVNLNPGKVEIIILQSFATSEKTTMEKTTMQTRELDREMQSETPSRTKIKTFKDLFTDTNPVSMNLDYDRARWEYLQEKHNL